MEPITEDDLDWLTRVENRLSGLRKRETEHRGTSLMCHDLTESIKAIHRLRQFMQARFGKTLDADL